MKENIIDNALELVEEVTGLSLIEIASGSRQKDYVYARMLLVRILFDKGMNKSEAGRVINRDPSTVWHMLKIYDDEVTHNPAFKEMHCKVKLSLL
jgi:chromosomal replication initiation ATPase DnaA